MATASLEYTSVAAKCKNEKKKKPNLWIQVKDKTHAVHKEIMITKSAYIHQMLNKNPSIGTENEPLKLTTIQSEAFEAIWSGIYDGKLCVTTTILPHVYETACLLQIEEISSWCVDKMIQNLNPQTAIIYRNIAWEHNLLELRKAAMKYTIHNISTVFGNQKINVKRQTWIDRVTPRKQDMENLCRVLTVQKNEPVVSCEQKDAPKLRHKKGFLSIVSNFLVKKKQSHGDISKGNRHNGSKCHVDNENSQKEKHDNICDEILKFKDRSRAHNCAYDTKPHVKDQDVHCETSVHPFNKSSNAKTTLKPNHSNHGMPGRLEQCKDSENFKSLKDRDANVSSNSAQEETISKEVNVIVVKQGQSGKPKDNDNITSIKNKLETDYIEWIDNPKWRGSRCSGFSECDSKCDTECDSECDIEDELKVEIAGEGQNKENKNVFVEHTMMEGPSIEEKSKVVECLEKEYVCQADLGNYYSTFTEDYLSLMEEAIEQPWVTEDGAAYEEVEDLNHWIWDTEAAVDVPSNNIEDVAQKKSSNVSGSKWYFDVRESVHENDVYDSIQAETNEIPVCEKGEKDIFSKSIWYHDDTEQVVNTENDLYARELLDEPKTRSKDFEEPHEELYDEIENESEDLHIEADITEISEDTRDISTKAPVWSDAKSNDDGFREHIERDRNMYEDVYNQTEEHLYDVAMPVITDSNQPPLQQIPSLDREETYIKECNEIGGRHFSVDNTRFKDEPFYQMYHCGSVARDILTSSSQFDAISDSRNERSMRAKSRDTVQSLYESFEQLAEEMHVLDNEFKSKLQNIVQSEAGQRTMWAEVKEVKDRDIVKSLTKRQRALQEALFEILTSEVSYVKSLERFIGEVVDSPFMTLGDPRCILTKSDIKDLFSNIKAVRDVSARFMVELDGLWEEDCVLNCSLLDVLTTYIEQHFTVYIRYLSNAEFQSRKYKQLRKLRTDFLAFVNKMEHSPVCQNLPFQSFLNLPMQRLTRMPLLVSAVKQNCENLQDYQRAHAAEWALKKLCWHCNEGARQMSNIEELTVLDKLLSFKSGVKRVPIVTQSRAFLKRGQLTLIKKESRSFPWKRRMVEVWIFLFNDVLLITKKKRNRFTNSLRYEVFDYSPRFAVDAKQMCHKELSELFAQRVPSACQFAVMLGLLDNHQHKQVVIFLACESQIDCDRWIDAFISGKDVDTDRLYETWDCPQMKVIQRYKAQDHDELTLEEADVVNVLHKTQHGWFKGERTRDLMSGWFPADHVVEIENEHARMRETRKYFRSNYILSNPLEK